MKILSDVTARSFRDAVREIVKYIKMCLALGGLPQIRTGYAHKPYEYGRYRGVMLVCYGRASFLPRVWVWAPESDPQWVELVEKLEKMVGDWRYILEKYGHLVPDEEVERELERLFPREVIEKLKKAPLIPVKAVKRELMTVE